MEKAAADALKEDREEEGKKSLEGRAASPLRNDNRTMLRVVMSADLWIEMSEDEDTASERWRRIGSTAADRNRVKQDEEV